MRDNKVSCQRGETQLGLIVGALIVGCVIAIGSLITGYMSDTKDERGQKTKEYFSNLGKSKETIEPRRTLKGYSVVIK